MPLDKNQKRPYSIEDYNDQWPLKFEVIKKQLQNVFKNKALAIEHVGSTSVPGMKAKPLIDILVVVDRMEDFLQEKEIMEKLDYMWAENYIAPNTIVFVKDDESQTKTENIHVCEKGAPKTRQFLVVRDYLRTHPEKAKEYQQLKEKLNTEFPEDYPAYRRGKDGFLKKLEKEAYEWGEK